jgi:hypothetical protein
MWSPSLRCALNDMRRRAFIRSFVKKVMVTGDEKLLTYTMPLMPDWMIQGKEVVLDTIQHGGRYRT